MDNLTQQAIVAGPQALFDHLFGTKYLPAYQQTLAEQNARRTDAFADDVTFEVCGEPIRLMTPRDFVWLDGLENPFVVGGAEAEIGDFQEFLWVLHAQNDPSRPILSAFRNGRMRNRVASYMATQDEWQMVAEIYDYIDRVFLDAGEAKAKPDAGAERTKRPPTVHDIAPLVVSACAAVGPVDPMNGRSIGDTPIPRLIQYQRAARNNSGAKESMTEFDTLRSQCLEEVNNLMHAHHAKGAK
jgi:hypothetical protein